MRVGASANSSKLKAQAVEGCHPIRHKAYKLVTGANNGVCGL